MDNLFSVKYTTSDDELNNIGWQQYTGWATLKPNKTKLNFSILAKYYNTINLSSCSIVTPIEKNIMRLYTISWLLRNPKDTKNTQNDTFINFNQKQHNHKQINSGNFMPNQ